MKNKQLLKRHKVSIASIFAILIMLSIIISVAISSVIFVSQYRKSILLTTEISSEQIVKQVSNSVGKDMHEIIYGLQLILQEIAIASGNADSEVNVHNLIDRYISVIPDSEAIIVYRGDGTIAYHKVRDGGGNLTEESHDVNLSFDIAAFNSLEDGEVHISLPHVQNMLKDNYPWVLTFTIPYINNGVREFLSLDLNVMTLLTTIDGVGVGEQGYIYVVNESNQIVYHPKQTMINIGLLNEDLNLLDGVIDSSIIVDDKVIVVKPVDEVGWRIVGVSLPSMFAEEQKKVSIMGVSVMILLGLVIGTISILMFRYYFSRPVNSLIKSMEEFELEVQDFEYNDYTRVIEIDRIAQSYEQMAIKIQGLVKTIIEEEQDLRLTEYRALQSQINPHFLYNTLDSILWMAEQKRNKDVVCMVGALANLFRKSISRGKEFISISDEVEHAQSYLTIQSYRYKNMFNFQFDIDDDSKELYCNKITLQPILENALIHGMSPADVMNINVHIYTVENTLMMEIKDDGVGISEEKLSTMLEDSPKSENGIGLNNVNNRIKIYFGEQYGVKVESVEDQGTKVCISLPVLHEEELDDEKI